MGYFIPEKLFVARNASSADTVKAVIVPVIKGNSSRKATAIKNTAGKGALPAIELDNTFEEGYSLLSFCSGRYRYSDDNWYILHPMGFEISIPSTNILELVSTCKIDEGVITTPLIWVTDGKNIRLVPSNSPYYTDAKTQVDAESFIPFKDIKIGDSVKFKNDTVATYLGVYHFLSNSAVQFDKAPSDCKSTRRYVFSYGKNITSSSQLQFNKFYVIATPMDIKEILTPSNNAVTAQDVMDEFNKSKQNGLISDSYKSAFVAVSVKPITLAKCTLTKVLCNVTTAKELMKGYYASSRPHTFITTGTASSTTYYCSLKFTQKYWNSTHGDITGHSFTTFQDVNSIDVPYTNTRAQSHTTIRESDIKEAYYFIFDII